MPKSRIQAAIILEVLRCSSLTREERSLLVSVNEVPSKIFVPKNDGVIEQFRIGYYTRKSLVKITAFWDTAPCSLMEVDRHFGGVYYLHHQGDDEGCTHLRNVGLLPRVYRVLCHSEL
jgi:hypothetical protein